GEELGEKHLDRRREGGRAAGGLAGEQRAQRLDGGAGAGGERFDVGARGAGDGAEALERRVFERGGEARVELDLGERDVLARVARIEGLGLGAEGGGA